MTRTVFYPSSPLQGSSMSQKTLPVCALACALMLSACSDGASTTTGPSPSAAESAAAEPAAFPREVQGVAIPAVPQRIVSGSATHTEVLYALGAGGRIVAVDLFSNYPAETAEKDHFDAFNLNVEAVASYDPDLVILSFDPGGAVAGLETLGIPVILFPTAPATIEDAYAEWAVLGMAIGADDEAEALIASTRAEIAAVTANVPTGGVPPTYYHELGPDLYSITSQTFIGSIYAMAGMTNVADPADEAGFGYPQLSAEYLLDTDPDFIFLADTVCCGQDADALAARPGWDTLGAVQGGRVILLDDDLASRWGPRILKLLEVIISAAYAPVG